VSAEAKAVMDTFETESRDHDPDATGEHAQEPPPKPKTIPDRATSVEDDNAEATPAVVVEGGEEPGEEGDEDKPDDKPKTPKKTVGERIRELTRARGDEERAKEALAEENASLKARLDALERGEKPPAKPNGKAAEAKDPAAPKASDFKYGEIDPDYLDAVIDFKTEQRLKAADAKREAEAVEKERAERTTYYEGKRDAMAEAGVAEFGEDYMTTVIEGAVDNKYPVSPVMAQLTLESEVGYKVAHHLATHPKEAREVAGKSPLAQAAYFGRLEERFLSGKKPAAAKTEPPEPPRVPNPPRSNVRGAGGKFTVTADTDDFAAFEAMANQPQRRG
jgi:hypothetical protein